MLFNPKLVTVRYFSLIFLLKFLVTTINRGVGTNLDSLYRTTHKLENLLLKNLSYSQGTRHTPHYRLIIEGWTPKKNIHLTSDLKYLVKRCLRKDLKTIGINEKFGFILTLKDYENLAFDQQFPWVYVEVEEQEGVKRKVELVCGLPYFEKKSDESTFPLSIGYIDKIYIEYKTNLLSRFSKSNGFLYDILGSNSFILNYLQLKNSFSLAKLGEIVFHIYHSYSLEFKLLYSGSVQALFGIGHTNILNLFNFSKFADNKYVCGICNFQIESNLLKYLRISFLDQKDSSALVENQSFIESKLTLVKNASIFYSNMVVKNNYLIENDLSQKRISDFVSGRWSFYTSNINNEGYLNLGNFNIEKIAAGYLIASKNDSNWYHFVLESLPKIHYLKQADNSLPVLISRGTPEQGKDLLSQLLPSHKIIELDPKVIYHIENLYMPNLTSWVADLSIASPSLEKIEYSFDTEAILNIKSRIDKLYAPIQNVEIEALFITRKSHIRNIENLDSLITGLRDIGVEIFDPSKSDFEVSFRKFACAKLVIFPLGAACANLLFMQKSSKAIFLSPSTAKGFKIYNELSDILDIEHHTLYQKSLSKRTDHYFKRINCNYIVDFHQLSHKIHESMNGEL